MIESAEYLTLVVLLGSAALLAYYEHGSHYKEDEEGQLPVEFLFHIYNKELNGVLDME